MSEGSAPPGDGGDEFYDPNAIYQRVKKQLGDMLSTPNNTEIVLQVLHDLDLNPGVARVIAAEAMKRLTPSELEEVTKDKQTHIHRLQTFLWGIVLSAFAVVLIGATTAMCITLVRDSDHKDRTVTQQILLTMFTTSVGFLSGLFTPNPLSGGGSSTADAFNLARFAMEQNRPKPPTS